MHRIMNRGVLPLVVVLAAAAAPADLGGPDRADADHSASLRQEQYLGRWNYDQPDAATMRNIAVINIPGGPRAVPQIGDIVFSRAAGGRIAGRTDQGCTWMFAVTRGSLELDPPTQTCSNPVRGLEYTITRWSVVVSGRHEREQFTAVSHHPDGDFDGALDNGRRTRAGDGDRSGTAPFLGAWNYDPPDPGTGVNIRDTRYPQPGGPPSTVRSPERGSVTFTRDFGSRVNSHTPDGCTWSLLIRGNTAKLDPPVQSCTHTGGTVVLQYWTIASDGHRQAAVMTGTDERGGSFTIAIGHLTRALAGAVAPGG